MNESGHPCDETIIYHRTRGGSRTKVRKQRKIHSARRALWRRFRIFGVDWDFMENRNQIADMKHARRTSSKQNKDVQDRMINSLNQESLKSDKLPKLSIKPRHCTYNVEATMFNEKSAGSSQVLSKSKASSVSRNYILRTSPDDVIHFLSHSLVLGR